MSNSRQTTKKKTTGNTGTKRSSTKTASVRNSSRSGKNSSGKKTQNKNQNSGIEREIGLVALLLVCVFLFVSNFGVGGAVGKILSGVLFGLFGCFGLSVACTGASDGTVFAGKPGEPGGNTEDCRGGALCGGFLCIDAYADAQCP